MMREYNKTSRNIDQFKQQLMQYARHNYNNFDTFLEELKQQFPGQYIDILNHQDDYYFGGNTALFLAIKNGHDNIVKQLIKSGAKLVIDTEVSIYRPNYSNHKKFWNGTALFLAIEGKHQKTIDIILNEASELKVAPSKKYYTEALHLAAILGDTETIQKLITKSKVNCNTELDYRNTALHLAIQYGNIDTALFLLDQDNIAFNVKNIEKFTPLMLAAKNGHTKIVKILIKKGADVSSQTNSRDTALTLAKKNGHTKIVEILINSGADLHIKKMNRHVDKFKAESHNYPKIIGERVNQKKTQKILKKLRAKFELVLEDNPELQTKFNQFKKQALETKNSAIDDSAVIENIDPRTWLEWFLDFFTWNKQNTYMTRYKTIYHLVKNIIKEHNNRTCDQLLFNKINPKNILRSQQAHKIVSKKFKSRKIQQIR